MIKKWREVLLRYEGQAENSAVAADLKNMMPGMMVEQIAAVLLENVNIFVMGFISTAAIAGVGQINTVNNVLMNLLQAFAIGGTVLVGQYVGAAKKKEAAGSAFSALFLGGLVSLLVTALVWLFRENVVMLLFGQAEADVIENSLAYFKFTALTPPLWFLYFQCCGFMRSAGDTRRPMYISIVLNVSSMALNLLFALGMHMGVTGSALAYLISVGVAAVLSLAMVMRKGCAFRPTKTSTKTMGENLRKISGVAFPASAENLMFNGSRIILQIFLAGMGKAMISANSVFNSVNGIFNVPVMALYYLTIPVISRCAGEQDREKVNNALRYISRKTLVWSIPVALAHVLLSVPGAYIFSRDPEVIRIGAGMLAIYAVFALFQNGSFILPNGFKSVGDAKFAMVLSSATAWIIRVLGTWFLGVKLGWGAYAIALTQGVDSAVRACVYTIRYKQGTWLIKMFGNTKV